MPETTAAPETAAPRRAGCRRRPPRRDTAAPEDAVGAGDDRRARDGRPDRSTEAAALPLANYDDLSIASLRARLRTLSADQLSTLIEYEKAHADRADVITMFERRIAKLNLGLTAGAAEADRVARRRLTGARASWWDS